MNGSKIVKGAHCFMIRFASGVRGRMEIIMEKKTVTIRMTETHDSAAAATPAAMMVQVASQYESKIYVDCGSVHVNAKSIMGMMTLDFVPGVEVEITAEGADEKAAIAGLEGFLTGQN